MVQYRWKMVEILNACKLRHLDPPYLDPSNLDTKIFKEIKKLNKAFNQTL